MKLFHTIPWGTWTGQKHNTLDPPCFCQRVLNRSRRLMFSVPSWEFCKATCERICLTSGPVHRKWTCWKCVFVCWLGVRVEGFKKQRPFFLFFLEISQEIIHHWREADRPGLCFILRSWGNYKSPGVRTSVSRPSCHLNTSCVFGDTRSSVFLRRTGVYSFELHGFLLL